MGWLGKTLLLAILIAAAGVAGWIFAPVAATPPAPRVRVEPPSAAVYANGAYLRPGADGVVRIDAARRGPVALRITAPGHAPATKAIAAVQPGQPAPPVETVTLAPVPTGSARLVTDPPGARVLLDGDPVGRTPLHLERLPLGRHHVDLVMTNYLLERVVLEVEAGAERLVERPLRHRQVQAYRQRIEADPSDILAYNDLGELLYVLGRHAEAAQVYVDGFVAAHEHPARDAVARKNYGKMEREYRKKHRDPTFQRLLDERIIDTVGAGEESPYLLKQFLALRRADRSSVESALKSLIDAHPDNPGLVLHLVQHYADARDAKGLDFAIDRFFATKQRRVDQLLRAGDALLDAYRKWPPKQRDVLFAGADRVVKELRAQGGKNPSAEMLYLEARLRLAQGEREQGEALLRQAIPKQGNETARNRLRIELARSLERGQAFEAARGVLGEVVASADKRSAEAKRARSMLQGLAAKIEREVKKRQRQEAQRKHLETIRKAEEAKRKAADAKKRAEEAKAKAEAEARAKAEANRDAAKGDAATGDGGAPDPGAADPKPDAKVDPTEDAKGNSKEAPKADPKPTGQPIASPDAPVDTAPTAGLPRAGPGATRSQPAGSLGNPPTGRGTVASAQRPPASARIYLPQAWSDRALSTLRESGILAVWYDSRRGALVVPAPRLATARRLLHDRGLPLAAPHSP